PGAGGGHADLRRRGALGAVVIDRGVADDVERGGGAGGERRGVGGAAADRRAAAGGEVEGGRPARDGAVQVGDGEGQGGGLRLADGLRGPGGDLGRLVDDDVRADEGGAPVVHLDRVEPVRPGVGEEVRGPDVHGGRLCGSQVDAGEVQRPGGRGGVVADVDLDVDHARRGAAAVVPLRL